MFDAKRVKDECVAWIRDFFENNGKDELYIHANAKCTYKTGIEMEALTAASVAALTVYDMCKAVDRAMVIKEIKLLTKSGGKSDYHYEG